MSQISQKSISGITSITTPAGIDDVFTVHSGDTTERFRVDQSGNQNITGIVTATNFKTGSSNLHSTGLTVGDSFVHSTGIDIGSNIKFGSTGVVTATSFVGDGSDLTGVSGFSTALSNDTSSLLNHIFKTSVQHNIGAGTSVTIQSDAGSGNIAFTRLDRINVATGATVRVAAGTTFLMNVLNVFT